MKRSLAFLPFAAAALLLASCAPRTQPDAGVNTIAPRPGSSVTVSEEVSYRGVLQDGGESTTSEGTHRLSLGDGRYLLLQSDDVDLDASVGEDVRVTGTVRQAVDGNADIMRVTRVESILTDEGDAASSVVEESFSSSAESSAAESSLPPQEATSVPASSSRSSSAQAAVSSVTAPVPVQSASSSAASVPPAQALGMAKEKPDAALWTQQYCTAHIGFCLPVHKNWWFKSFGTTASSLWHVEISAREIENMGEGAIQIDFESGALPDGVADGNVVVSGDNVTGYRAWTGQRHFTIAAPKVLRDAVTFMTANLSTYDVESQ